MTWKKNSAGTDSAEAHYVVGRIHLEGLGVTAADQGLAAAMLALGRLYVQGVGVNRDPVSAYVWLHRAALGDDAEVRRIARPIRDAMESSLTRTQRLQARERLARTPDRNGPDKDTGRRR